MISQRVLKQVRPFLALLLPVAFCIIVFLEVFGKQFAHWFPIKKPDSNFDE